MTGESIIRFLMIEAVLICAMLLSVWGISKTDWDAKPKQIATTICYVLFGGLALIVLIRFVGV
jgi:hypothetical protein